jgi:hypothetical protein
MSYELMGIRQVIERSMALEAIALASPETSPETQEFNAIRERDGLKAALSWNAQRFSEAATLATGGGWPSASDAGRPQGRFQGLRSGSADATIVFVRSYPSSMCSCLMPWPE